MLTNMNKRGDMNGIESNQASTSQDQTSQEENLFQENTDLDQGGDTQSTDSDTPGDMNGEENNQVPSQASTSQDQTDQEENLFQENTDLDQGGDTQGTDSDTPGDMNGEGNNQVSSQASTSQDQTSQEENLFQENSDLCQETCTESAGSEIHESSHLTRVPSTEEAEVLTESLGDLEGQNDRVKEPWEEERDFCLQSVALLSHEIHDLKQEIKRTSKIPRSKLCPFVRTKGRKALRENLEVEDKCHELNVLMKLNIELKADLEKQVQHLEKLENNHKRLQAQETEKILFAQAEESARSSAWRNFILSFESE